MPRRGRPLKLTAARQKRIVEAARLGAHREQAARAAGVARSTLQAWLARGQADDAPRTFRDFAQALRAAETEAELDALRSIERAAGQGDWRARVWLLERRWPERWGRRTSVELSGPEGEPIELHGGSLGDVSKLSEPELEQLQTLLDRAHDRRD